MKESSFKESPVTIEKSEVSTKEQFKRIIGHCRDLFVSKQKDYGTSWLIMRPSSITDQVFIKAKRIRSIQEKGEQKVGDPIEDDYVGIINYCIMALILIEIEKNDNDEVSSTGIFIMYDQMVDQIMELLENKNHDYGEAWRGLRVSSIIDIMLMKLLRIRSIEDNNGMTEVSEGVASGYMDLINYSIFSIILMEKGLITLGVSLIDSGENISVNEPNFDDWKDPVSRAEFLHNKGYKTKFLHYKGYEGYHNTDTNRCIMVLPDNKHINFSANLNQARSKAVSIMEKGLTPEEMKHVQDTSLPNDEEPKEDEVDDWKDIGSNVMFLNHRTYKVYYHNDTNKCTIDFPSGKNITFSTSFKLAEEGVRLIMEGGLTPEEVEKRHRNTSQNT